MGIGVKIAINIYFPATPKDPYYDLILDENIAKNHYPYLKMAHIQA